MDTQRWVFRQNFILSLTIIQGHRERKSLSSLTQVAANPHIYRCFGSAFTRQMHLVQTTPSFLKKLEQKIAPCRPEYRRVKGIDHSELLVIVAPDAARIPPSLSGYSYGSAICVEIKPKFGAFFLWPSTDSVHTVKSSSGLFCLRQNHSTKQSRWQQLSNYCPCDLFSGDRNRMSRSLWALLDTPQINLRIHLDTQLIFSYEVDGLDKGLDSFFWDTTYNTCDGVNGLNGFNGVCANGCNEKSVHKCKKNRDCPFTSDRDRLIRGLLLDALLHELNSENDSSAPISLYPGDRVAFSMNCRFHRALRRAQYPQLDASKVPLNGDSNTTSSDPLPPDGSILGRVLATQLLSRVDICFVVPHYERVCECLIANGLTWDDFVGLADSDRAHLLGDSPELVESFDIVEKYLISLVARDCSIMICLRRALPGCPDWVPTVGNTCACVPRMIMNAVIIDLDPKPLKKIRGRLSVEESIVHQTLAQHPWLLDSD
ncbi:inositol-pentakisphosphate 2-kinase [Clonorchis sinensis]|uniref:Inositol-pentakisphosphate 2-kinase n=1 Tax=Clonorchis sinensis TaxID=79923 RepID=H2KPB9_CLOSI|nr:inositol-pentakisphosphate 2-kinase [Clonorchis sinensis]